MTTMEDSSPFARCALEHCSQFYSVQEKSKQLDAQFSSFLAEFTTKQSPLLEPVAASHMDFLRWALCFLMEQDKFLNAGKPIGVEVAFHYTSERAIKTIRREGLVTSSAMRGVYGKGIYVGNNPHAFQSYGEVGLVVLVLKGVQRQMYSSDESDVKMSVDSFQGNKIHKNAGSTYFSETILRRSNQVLPLLIYPRALTNNADLLWRLQVALHQWIGGLFPHGWSKTHPERIVPNYRDIQHEHILREHHNKKMVRVRTT